MNNKKMNLYEIFEQEFGRPFSPMELQQLMEWEREYKPEIIVQALKEAVIAGKRNMRYIDRILLNWQHENIQTKQEAIDYGRNFRAQARMGYGSRSVAAGNKAAGDLHHYDEAIAPPEFYDWLNENEGEG